MILVQEGNNQNKYIEVIFKADAIIFRGFLEGREEENCTQEAESKAKRWVEKTEE